MLRELGAPGGDGRLRVEPLNGSSAARDLGFAQTQDTADDEGTWRGSLVIRGLPLHGASLADKVFFLASTNAAVKAQWPLQITAGIEVVGTDIAAMARLGRAQATITGGSASARIATRLTFVDPGARRPDGTYDARTVDGRIYLPELMDAVKTNLKAIVPFMTSGDTTIPKDLKPLWLEAGATVSLPVKASLLGKSYETKLVGTWSREVPIIVNPLELAELNLPTDRPGWDWKTWWTGADVRFDGLPSLEDVLSRLRGITPGSIVEALDKLLDYLESIADSSPVMRKKIPGTDTSIGDTVSAVKWIRDRVSQLEIDSDALLDAVNAALYLAFYKKVYTGAPQDPPRILSYEDNALRIRIQNPEKIATPDDLGEPVEGGDWWPTTLEPMVRQMFDEWVAAGEPAAQK